MDMIIDEQVAENLKAIKNILKNPNLHDPQRKKLGFYKALDDGINNGTRPEREQISYLEAFETALTVFKEASIKLRTEMDVLTKESRYEAIKKGIADRIEVISSEIVESPHLAKYNLNNHDIKVNLEKQLQGEIINAGKDVTDSIMFSNRYALAFAGHVGLALLDADRMDTDKLADPGRKYDISKDSDKIVSLLSATAADDLEQIIADKKKANEEVNSDTLKDSLRFTFTTWTNQLNWNTFKDVAEKENIEKEKLKYGNFSIIKGDFSRKHDQLDIDNKFMDVRKSDIIGAEEYVNIIWQHLLKLGGYRHEFRDNAANPAKVIFTYGDPGCGKTFISHALIMEFAELCKRKGYPLKALTHSTTDYASSYQNATANALNELAAEINGFPGPVIMYVADADNIFLARSDPSLTAEQRQTMGVYFKMFDGTLIKKNGKFLAIMDANYLHKIDGATQSRLFDETLKLKRFEKAEDFAKLFRKTLEKGTEGTGISDKEWLKIGKNILDSPFQNREIDHIVNQLRGSYSVDESIFDMTHQQIIDSRNAHMKSISYKTIMGKIEEKISTLEEISEDSRTKEILNIYENKWKKPQTEEHAPKAK